MSIRIGNKIVASNNANNLATTEQAGIIRIATDEEVKAGLKNDIAITPYQLANAATKTSVDGETITKDENDVITSIGVKSKNDVLMYNWIGTEEEYKNAYTLGKIDPSWVCYITDDDMDFQVIPSKYGSDVALLDIIISNQELTGTEKIGKLPQGSVVYKSEYPDAYNKLLYHKQDLGSREVTETVADVEVKYVKCQNGFKIIDISNKVMYNNIFANCGTVSFFLLDEENELFYLPKTNNLLRPNLYDVGGFNEAGLPNITGTFSGHELADGAFTLLQTGLWHGHRNTDGTRATIGFDASLSNPIYGKSDTVQPASSNVFIYYKVGNTVQNDANINLEAQVANLQNRNNIPFSLLECKYSQFKLSNLSWLLSEGQWNDGNRYTAVYNKLNEIYQIPVDGFSVKLSDEEYTDYDFVLNLADETFRLPIKTKLASGNSVVGNGMCIGYTNGTINFGAETNSDTNYPYAILSTENYGADVGNAAIGVDTRPTTVAGIGITTDPTKSGIETSDSDLYLYFYVGETLQGLNDIDLSDLGRLLSIIENLQARVLELETNINAGGASGEVAPDIQEPDNNQPENGESGDDNGDDIPTEDGPSIEVEHGDDIHDGSGTEQL